MAKKKALIGGIHPAVISVWAAILAASHLLPAIPLIGVGGTMSVSTALAPLSGVFFGPIAGALCTAIGSFIGDLIAPSGAWLGIFTFVVPTTNAIAAGLLSKGKKTSLGAIIMYVVGFCIWMSFKIGRSAWIHGVMCNGLGILCALICVFLGKKALMSKNYLLKTIALWIICYGGMMAACTYAGSMNILMFQTPAISFKMVIWIGLVERVLFSTAATIVGIPLLAALPRIGIYVGPRDEALDAVEALEDATDEVK